MSVNLKHKAGQIRRDVIETAFRNEAGHIAPSLSTVDILVALYYSAMNYCPDDPHWGERDRLILSKSHGCYALYSILADIGTLPKQKWKDFYTDKSDLKGCAERNLDYGIEAGCGSLGHGLPMAVGIAYAAKLRGDSYHIFCLVGDGEMQEGTCWEALLFATKHKLNNLTIIIDQNNLQAMDFIRDVMDNHASDLIERIKGFWLEPQIAPGHDTEALAEMLHVLKHSSSDTPNCLVAQTTKGYGLKAMENVPQFHFRLPTPDELKAGGAAYE